MGQPINNAVKMSLEKFHAISLIGGFREKLRYKRSTFAAVNVTD